MAVEGIDSVCFWPAAKTTAKLFSYAADPLDEIILRVKDLEIAPEEPLKSDSSKGVADPDIDTVLIGSKYIFSR